MTSLSRTSRYSGLCPCGKTKLCRYTMTRGWQEIPGIVCSHCPSNDQVSFLKTQIAYRNLSVDALKKKLATAESNVGKERKINDDLKEKLATAESNVGKERKINDDLKEKLAAAEANYEQSESEISAAKEAASELAKEAASELAEERLERSMLASIMEQKIVILGSAAKRLKSAEEELAKERQKNDELGKKLVETQKIAFGHIFTTGFKDHARQVGLEILKNPLCLYIGEDSFSDLAIRLVKHVYGRLGRDVVVGK